MAQISDKLFTRVLKAKCMDCCGGNKLEMEHCKIIECPLHTYMTVARAPRKKGKRKDADAKKEQG